MISHADVERVAAAAEQVPPAEGNYLPHRPEVSHDCS